jgi:hypothetical protein
MNFKLWLEQTDLNRIWKPADFWGKQETIGEYLKRHNIPIINGIITLYHGRPKNSKYNVLKIGTYLTSTPEEAQHFAARDRDLNPNKDIEILVLKLTPDDINPGVFITLRRPYNLK